MNDVSAQSANHLQFCYLASEIEYYDFLSILLNKVLLKKTYFHTFFDHFS